jgi:hypothetical protein
LGTVFRELAQRKECKIEEGHLMPDQIANGIKSLSINTMTPTWQA